MGVFFFFDFLKIVTVYPKTIMKFKTVNFKLSVYTLLRKPEKLNCFCKYHNKKY